MSSSVEPRLYSHLYPEVWGQQTKEKEIELQICFFLMCFGMEAALVQLVLKHRTLAVPGRPWQNSYHPLVTWNKASSEGKALAG